MNIWVAQAKVYYDYDKEWKYKFTFYSKEEEFDIDTMRKCYIREIKTSNKNVFDLLPKTERIPINMEIEETNLKCTVIQGFNHKLNEAQLNHIEMDMKFYLSKHLIQKYEEYEKNYKKKLNVIGLFS